jgi:DNA-binding Lrp family transcriptional regulator
MAKSSSEQIEQDEIKVLNVLEQHSKDSVDEIAKSCGFSRQKVWRIIKNLEKRKVIWGYSAVTDENAKNLKHFTLIIKRKSIPFDEAYKKELTFDKLDDYSSDVIIENIYLTHGRFDGIATFYAKDIISAKKLVNEISSRIGKYFDDYILLETLFPIRKQRIKNPQMKELAEYL